MSKYFPPIPQDAEPILDTTLAIPLRSKRTERAQKKRHLKTAAAKQHATLLDLPFEVMIQILTLLQPSSLFALSLVSKPLRSFISEQDLRIGTDVIDYRYAVLAKCFPRPVLLSNVDVAAHADLNSEERQTMLGIHKKPYQHVQSPDCAVLCTCLTCMLAWNNLNLVLDFAGWMRYLDTGEPIPIIPRGKNPRWNRKLISSHAEIVLSCLSTSSSPSSSSPSKSMATIKYARILQSHLTSITHAIHRHGNNKGNKRRRFLMSPSDLESGTDVFLEKKGPPSMEFPFSRDNYYMLEAYLPNRGWSAEKEGGEGWVYMPASQHERDVEFVRVWARRRGDARAKEALISRTVKAQDEENENEAEKGRDDGERGLGVGGRETERLIARDEKSLEATEPH